MEQATEPKGVRFLVSFSLKLVSGQEIISPIRICDTEDTAKIHAMEAAEAVDSAPRQLIGFVNFLGIASIGVRLSRLPGDDERRIVQPSSLLTVPGI